jgi:hypothetical protein
MQADNTSLEVLDRSNTVHLEIKKQSDQPKKSWELLQSLIGIIPEERVRGFQQVGPNKFQITMKSEQEARQVQELVQQADIIDGMVIEARQMKRELSIIAYNCPTELTDPQLAKSLERYLVITGVERQTWRDHNQIENGCRKVNFTKAKEMYPPTIYPAMGVRVLLRRPGEPLFPRKTPDPPKPMARSTPQLPTYAQVLDRAILSNSIPPLEDEIPEGEKEEDIENEFGISYYENWMARQIAKEKETHKIQDKIETSNKFEVLENEELPEEKSTDHQDTPTQMLPPKLSCPPKSIKKTNKKTGAKSKEKKQQPETSNKSIKRKSKTNEKTTNDTELLKKLGTDNRMPDPQHSSPRKMHTEGTPAPIQSLFNTRTPEIGIVTI